MNIFSKAWTWFCLNVVPNIHWNWTVGMWHHGKYWRLTAEDWSKIQTILDEENLVICIRRNTHFTTYLIWIANRIKVGYWGFYSHAFMNLEGDNEPTKLVQATAIGTAWVPFDQAFNCDSVKLLRPKGYSKADWAAAIQEAISDLGKPYDTLFNISQNQSLSCVELVRDALKKAPDYATRFADFEALIQKVGDLTPDMMANCKDFDVVLEIRR